MTNTNSMVKLLMIDNQPSGDDFINNPTWQDIESALFQMNGQYRTYLGLYKTDDPTEEDFLMVGGGLEGNFVCGYYNQSTEYYVYNEQAADPETLIDVPIGQMGARQKKYCHPIQHIIDPVRYFFETGNMHPHVKWIKV